MLTNGSLQGVTILKDKILEDNTGVASHPDNQQQKQSPVVQTATGDCFFHIPLRRNAGLIPDCRFMIMLLWL